MTKMTLNPRTLAAAALLLLLGAGCAPASAPAPSPPLARETALALLKDEVADCEPDGIAERYRSCTVTVFQEGNRYAVTVTHDGFFDDSVKASRLEVVLMYQDGAWVKGETVETYQCWPGRGHQEFSAELCV